MLSLSEEYIKHIKGLIGEDNAKEYFASLNSQTTNGIVINNKKINNNILNELINEYRFKEKFTKKYYTYEKRDDYSIGKNIYHHMGVVYSQEPSSYEVINNLEISNDFNFIDLCASPGGKSIDAILKQNRGFGILNEIDSDRCQILKSNIERMGFTNLIITNNNPKDFLLNFFDYFDLVIVDAPCSGEGMFRKSDIAIKNWSKDYIKYISKIQKEILDVAVKLVKPSGYLIFSTCTFSKEEDEDNVDYILDKNKDFKILKKDKLFPHIFNGEGQFYSIFKKNRYNNFSENFINDYRYENELDIPASIKKQIVEYFNDILNIDVKILTEKNKDMYNIYLINRYLYNVLNKLENIRIKYKGLYIGYIDKNGYTPSNELAHSEYIKYYKYKIDVDIDNANKYIRGEVININDKIMNLNNNFDFNTKEYVVLTYNNIGLGVGKLVDKKVKNLYPKGLRNI